MSEEIPSATDFCERHPISCEVILAKPANRPFIVQLVKVKR